MTKKVFTFIVASAVAFTVACLPLAAPTSASSCDDVKFIFARGTDQALNASEATAFEDNIRSALNHAGLSMLKTSFYELGSGSYNGASYPAAGVDLLQMLGEHVSASNTSAFYDSVSQGEQELKSYLSAVNKLCPETKFVLGGYSQGAMVITNSIPELNPDNIIFVATFGDPLLYLPEGEGIMPAACRGEKFSSYRIFAPECHTAAGILGAKKPYEPIGWSEKIGLWCNQYDFICGAGLKTSAKLSSENIINQLTENAFSAGHNNYVSDGHFYTASRIIAKKIGQDFHSSTFDISEYGGNRDVVFLIDRTASMQSHIELYQDEARKLAKEVIDDGGRIALYTYGDLDDKSFAKWTSEDVASPKKLLGLSDDFDSFSIMLNNIETFGGGEDDEESVLSALKIIMNLEQWKPRAAKSIILLTDAGYLSPDRDGTTLEQVVKLSLEIDPVNIYIINQTETISSYRNLTDSTNGEIFRNINSSSTDYVYGRSIINLALPEYHAAINEEIIFMAQASISPTRYEWDLDLDGVFETITDGPVVTKSYTSPIDGYIQVRIIDSEGRKSNASAKVSISDSSPTQPEINNVHLSRGDNESFYLDYAFEEKAVAALISINGNPLGISTRNHLVFENCSDELEVSITPIADDGRTGIPILIHSAFSSGDESNAYEMIRETKSTEVEDTLEIHTEQGNAYPDKILAPNAGKRY